MLRDAEVIIKPVVEVTQHLALILPGLGSPSSASIDVLLVSSSAQTFKMIEQNFDTLVPSPAISFSHCTSQSAPSIPKKNLLQIRKQQSLPLHSKHILSLLYLNL